MNIKDFLLPPILLILLTSCGGNSNSSAGSGGSDSNYTTQALLGPVVDADVEIYDATDLSAGMLCRSQSSGSKELDLAGRISIQANCIDQEGLYLLLISGGDDIDADDDGLLDDTPTQVDGRFHTILTGDQVISGDAKATVLTEAAYQNVRYLLATGSGQTRILQGLDSSAHSLLKQDLNGDGLINHLDLALWHPRLDRETTRPGLEQLQLIIQDIHHNRSTAENAVKLFDSIEPSVAEFTDLDHADRLIINDRILYTANPDGLSAIDISDPDNLQILRQVEVGTTGEIEDMRVNGDWLYVRNRDNDGSLVTLFDISDQNDPVLSVYGLYRPDGFELNEFFVEGGYAYAALHRVNNPDDYDTISHDFRLDILDLSDPTQPTLISSLELDTFVSAIAVEGERLYVGTDIGPYLESGALNIIDISNPESPNLISKLELNAVRGLQVIGNLGYAITVAEIAGGSDYVISLLDLKDDNAPSVIGSIDTPYDISSFEQLFIQNDRGYLAASGGISVYDFSDPTNPRRVDHLITKGRANSLALSESIVFAAIDQLGLQMFDMSGGPSVESPAIVGDIELADVMEIALSGENHAYLLSGQEQSRRVVSLDLSDLQNVDIESTETFPDLYQNPLVIDQHLYVTSMFSGVNLFDISNPMTLSLPSNYDQSMVQFASAITVQGSRLVVGGGEFFEINHDSFSLSILNVEQSGDPLLLGQLAISYQPVDIAIKDDVVFVLGSADRLTTYRISATNDLSELGSLMATDNSGGPSEIILTGEYGFMSQYGGLISVLDISDPSMPDEILSIDTQGNIADMDLAGDLLFIAGQAGNIQVLNVKAPETPRYVGNFHATTQVRALSVIKDHLLVATEDKLLIADLPVESVP